MTHVPFNRPPVVGNEHAYIQEAIDRGHLSADGPFSRRCSAWLEDRTGCARAVVTHSATAALEMAALLLDVEPGDEIVMPSFTFVTTASAFALRGGVPVFVDIRPDTLNLDESRLEAAITERTRAIVAVHYAGVACELDEIGTLAAAHGLSVVEDSAQGLMSTYRGRALGTFGELAALSFHETKNVVAGEGGALLVNEGPLAERALVVRDKGTNRVRFYRGEVDKYSWVELGSSFGLSELNAAFLWAQLEHAEELTADRMRTWRLYHEAFAELEERELARRPIVPPHTEHNAHMYYLLVRDLDQRTALLERLDRDFDVNAVFHYVPLHSSAAGRRYGRAAEPMNVTDDVAERLVRLPLWAGLAESDAQRVVDGVYAALTSRVGS